MIRVIIADDEAKARNGIRSLLRDESDMQVIAESGDGRDTLEKIEILRPDALFLDIQMPGLSGIEMLKSEQLSKQPHTIITTAYADYGLQAIEIQAIDYLLKPFDRDRFKSSLIRLRRFIHMDERASGKVEIDDLISRISLSLKTAPLAPSNRLSIKIGRKIRFLDVTHMSYLIANGNYVNIHMTTGEVIHTSERISEMEEKLFSHHFVRIHRSVILNVDQIREGHSRGSYLDIVMSDGKCLTSGLTYKKKLHEALIPFKKKR